MELPPFPPRAARIQIGGEPGFDPAAPYDELRRLGLFGLGQRDGQTEWSIRLTNLPDYVNQPMLIQHASTHQVFFGGCMLQ